MLSVALLPILIWFSAQAPVTPALALIVSQVAPSSCPARTVTQVPEDVSNSPIPEHIAEHRRVERPSSGNPTTVAAWHHVPGQSCRLKGGAASFAPASTGRAILMRNCILRT